MTVARLNLFQKLVRQWDRLHPYNAAQILRLAGGADVGELREKWGETLVAMGLGRVRIEGSKYYHEVIDGRDEGTMPRCVEEGKTLEEYITAEMNRPFDEIGESPFRPFILQEEDSYLIGIVYHHWAADSVSIRMLLREWFLRQYDPGRARQKPFQLAQAEATHRWGNRRLGRALLGAMRWGVQVKGIRRLQEKPFNDLDARFRLYPAPTGLIDQLQQWTRAREVTVNDLFMAVIAEVCDRHVPAHHKELRTGMALGSIVDLRPHMKGDLSDTFGVFLGFANVICRQEDLSDFSSLLQTISAQNKLHKEGNFSGSNTLQILIGLAAGKWMGRKRLLNFYRKRMPLSGGISNVNLNRSWAAEYYPSPLQDYIRVSPAGPTLPIVFTPSTLGENFHFGITYRPSIVSEEKVALIAEEFLQRLTQFANQLSKPGI